MRFGLRVQLLALLGALMLLAFVPLFFATSAYTRVAFDRLKQHAARNLAESVAVHVNEARPLLDEGGLVALLSAQTQGGAVRALYVYSPSGTIIARAGQPELMNVLPVDVPRGRERMWLFVHHNQTLLAVFAPNAEGGVAAITSIDTQTDEAKPLVALMGLYMVVIALLVLVVAYYALTRWIVRPILELESAAERIAAGGRSLKVLRSGPAELIRLSNSLVTMTETLLREEDSLRRKIEEVEATTVALRATQASLVRSERLATVARLAAGLAHEIGNPISALMGFEDLLLEGGLSSAEQKDFLERMRKETSRIHRVLGDLLAYARPTRREAQSPVEPGRPDEAIEDVVALLRPQKDLSAMSLLVQVDADLPAVPLGQEELTQVLLNLVMNSVDACQRRGQIMVSARQTTTDCVQITVEDDGPGVSVEVAETLFEPFVSTKEAGQGTGLGLAVTRGLVESAHGTIRLDLDHSPGARFVVTLPLAKISSSTVTA